MQKPESPTTASTDRTRQENTIQHLVENSKAHELNAAKEHTGANTHHNEHQEIQSWNENLDVNVEPNIVIETGQRNAENNDSNS